MAVVPSWTDSFLERLTEIRLSAAARSRNVRRGPMLKTKLVLYFIGGGGGGGGGGVGGGGDCGGDGVGYPRLLIFLC